MELETVGRVAVGNLGLQVGRQVDDMDSAERTFLGTDTATNAKAFGNEGDLGFGAHFNTELSGTDDGAGLLALLATFLQNMSITVTHFNDVGSVIVPSVCTKREKKKTPVSNHLNPSL